MRHPLYSELRTVYETTSENPRTFRLTIKLKDMVDEAVLADAVRKTMARYPYFCMQLVVDGDELFFEDNPAPVPVLHTDGPIVLGGSQVQGHLMAFCWWKNKVHIDVWHALTDGGGLYHMIKTFLYHYCSTYYERELSNEGIWLEGDEVSVDEWVDPARLPIDVSSAISATKWSGQALQIGGPRNPHAKHPCIIYNIRIPEDEFMRFNLSLEGSPATIVALFLSRAIASLHPEATDPVAIALCVNQRRALQAPLAHQSLVGDARLVFRDRMKSMSFEKQEVCYRGMVVLQADEGMVLREVKEYQELVQTLANLPSHEARHEHCVRLAREKSRLFTATVSYVGKAKLGDAEFYVQEFHALPSTALPSCATPLTLELSAVNGSFYVNFIQFFEGEAYLRAFISQLRENGINYDVLYQEPTKYPGIVLPWV